MRILNIAVAGGPKPVYLRIADALRAGLRRGLVRAGEPLPSTRELATQVGVHRHTVRAALDELVAEGWLVSEERRCYRAAAIPVDRYFEARTERPRKAKPHPLRLAREVKSRKLSDDFEARYDFRSGLSDLREFPLAEYRSHLGESLRRYGTRLLGYGSAQGHAPLLSQLEAYLRRARSIGGRELIITHGSQEGIFLAAQLLVKPGDRVGVERLSYPPAIEAFRLAGAELVTLPVDSQGLDTRELARVLRRGRLALIYTTPLHQYPTTVALSLERRHELLRLASRHGVPIVEDDYDHEYHYTSQPLPPLAAEDPEGLVLYVSSFSKILLPSVRLGFLAVEKRLLEPLLAIRSSITRQNDLMTQDAVARWMRDGGFERHLRRMRRLYEQRLGSLTSELGRLRAAGVDLDWRAPDGGMTLWLDTKVDSERLAREAARHGLALDAGSRFALDGRRETHLRLGFARHTPAETRDGLALMCKAIRR